MRFNFLVPVFISPVHHNKFCTKNIIRQMQSFALVLGTVKGHSALFFPFLALFDDFVRGKRV